MKPEPSLPDPMSIGGETLAFTMQAEIGSAALDLSEFEMPDEPGMVRIPVTLDVLIPDSLLHPPRSPHGSSVVSGPPAEPKDVPRARFGSYPRAAAARNLARAFRDTLRGG